MTWQSVRSSTVRTRGRKDLSMRFPGILANGDEQASRLGLCFCAGLPVQLRRPARATISEASPRSAEFQKLTIRPKPAEKYGLHVDQPFWDTHCLLAREIEKSGLLVVEYA